MKHHTILKSVLDLGLTIKAESGLHGLTHTAHVGDDREFFRITWTLYEHSVGGLQSALSHGVISKYAHAWEGDEYEQVLAICKDWLAEFREMQAKEESKTLIEAIA